MLGFWKSSPSPSGRKTVLTVDDSATMLAVLNGQLLSLGFEVLQAASGEEGLKLAASKKPDLILMDVTMPWMTGIEALQKLKENPKTAAIPVIMCTAEQSGKDLERAFAYGAAAYIIKPPTPERLKEKIDKALAPRP